jgi:hypothetical protein
MFDTPLLLEQIQNSIIAAKQTAQTSHAQPEYHESILHSHVRSLPEDWKSETKRLVAFLKTPSLEDVLQALSIDIESSGNVPSRLSAYQSLLRFAIVIYSLKTDHRSTGP